jgi:undecaprenyl-diphosphatase
MPPAEQPLSARHAVALGLLHGPAELLPISSSAHTTLIPWIAGWPYARLDGHTRKSFEVALHAGTALALAIDMRGELREQARAMTPGQAAMLGLALAPAAIAGLALRERIERHLGGPRSIAIGLAAGAIAMGSADRRAARAGARGTCSERERREAGGADSLALGLAQATALVPGVSRSGAALTAARARGFSRGAAEELSWSVGLPVLIGAGGLEGWRLLREGLPAGTRAAFGLASAAAFVSTLASARLLRGRALSLLPYSLYRCLLAAVVVVRGRRAGEAR